MVSLHGLHCHFNTMNTHPFQVSIGSILQLLALLSLYNHLMGTPKNVANSFINWNDAVLNSFQSAVQGGFILDSPYMVRSPHGRNDTIAAKVIHHSLVQQYLFTFIKVFVL